MSSILYGIISGALTGVALGGGTILVFLLTTFGGLNQHLAQGINLIYFIPTSLASIIVNLKNKKINIKLAIAISILGVIGAIIGAKLSLVTDAKKLKKYFAIFLLFIAFHEIYILIKQYINYKKRDNNNIENKRQRD